MPVQVGQTGPYNGSFPVTLVRPDRNNFAPRLGLAWKPLRNTVVRAGYGINYNTSAYQSIVQNMAFQPPFSTTATNTQSATTQLTLQNGFPPVAPGSITNNFGVDPNYRLGYVQIWNRGHAAADSSYADHEPRLHRDQGHASRYSGSSQPHRDRSSLSRRAAVLLGRLGGRFDCQRRCRCASANGLQAGISIGGRYTFSKSLDNASTIGSGEPLVAQGAGRTALSGTTNVAQNAFDLAAERGLSSFDQRHNFTADYLWELPFGHDRRWLAGNSPLRAVFGDWNWSGDWTIASGLPFTPRILGDSADVSRGTNGTVRADVVPGQLVTRVKSVDRASGSIRPRSLRPRAAFGDARRNSIEGPGQPFVRHGVHQDFSPE